MKTETWVTLLDTLAQATESGRLRWRRSDVPAAWLMAEPSGSVELRRFPTAGLAKSYTVRLLDVDGVEQDSVEASTLRPTSTGPEALLLRAVERLAKTLDRIDAGAESVARDIIADVERRMQHGDLDG